MNVEQWPIDKVIPYDNNPRDNDDAVEAVANSIKEFSFQQPIVVDKDGVIIVGHTRLKAAQKLHLAEVPVSVAENLTDEQVRAYRLADNKTAEFADWDWDRLTEELDSIVDIDMEDFGFELDNGGEIEDLESENDGYTDKQAEQAPARVKRGDIWQLGNHRLMCGDSTSETNIKTLIGGGVTLDLLLTDPPYGVNIVQGAIDGGDKMFGTTSRPKSREIVPATKYAPIIGDDTTETAWKSYEIAKKKTSVQILFGGNYFTDFLEPSRCWIVWDKGVPDGAFFAPVELAWVSKDGNAKLYKRLWSGLCREGNRSVEGLKRMHPTQKPVSLMCDIINDFTDNGSTVLDLFGGSGSTLIAAEQLNRKCYMMELDPHYCDVIIDRWETLTGDKAVKIG